MQVALIPSFIDRRTQTAVSSEKWVLEGLAFFGGVILLAALAQLQVRLPWTPVPITGQTFGVALIALTWGSKRSLAVVAGYLAFGAAGAPIFAYTQSGLAFGPTVGYLFGMLMASVVVGFLADHGFARTYWRALFAAYIGSALTFACGLFVLSYFVPRDQLLVAGLIPFLAGDFVKNALAAAIATGANKVTGRSVVQ